MNLKKELHSKELYNWIKGMILTCVILFPSMWVCLKVIQVHIFPVYTKYQGMFTVNVNDNAILMLGLLALMGGMILLTLLGSVRIVDFSLTKLGWGKNIIYFEERNLKREN